MKDAPAPTLRRAIRFGLLLAGLLACASTNWAQPASDFPQAWLGKWKGDLQIFNGPTTTQRVPMTLEISPTDTVGRWKWVMRYGDQDARDYRLILLDATAGLYDTDEQNGIVLSERFLGGKFISHFTVMSTTLVATYERVGETLVFEILIFSADQPRSTGLGTAEIPTVKVLPGLSRHYAVLRRQ
jgi:hypothetical protein